MKKLFFTSLFFAVFYFSNAQDTAKSKLNDTLLLENIEINAIRASDRAPFTKTNLDKKEIAQNNLGQDLPFVLNQLPSVVVNSDAGTGIGYTGISIRGSDATRTNVTINGIPYNDAESQQTYFVDLPDFSSSLSSIQVERGVGTSSNGAGAFGATINLSTNEVNKEKYVELNNSFGSYNTWKNTVKFGTGLLKKHVTFDARLSGISSNGYIDRATSNLRSLFASAAYITGKSSLRFNIITGKEKTYQAWYGVPEDSLATDRTYNPAGTEKPGSPYSNETDNYIQTHYQLFYDHKINENVSFNAGGFLSRGKGYYEEYRAGEAYGSYGLPDYISGTDTFTTTDLIRRLWLDNYFYGGIFSLQYQKHTTHLTLGGGWDKYDGKHYDIVTWAQQGFPNDYVYSNVPAHKRDFNLYGKLLQTLGGGFSAFADIEGRFINYNIDGFEDDPGLVISKKYSFITPKAGISFNRNKMQVYASYSIGAKEPNRDDFEAGLNEQPKPEILYDWELGTNNRTGNFTYGITFYYMKYHNQLVSTGKINDVGAYTRTNAPESYRLGVELQASEKFTNWLNASGNISFSKNRIKNFTEYVDDWDNGGQIENQYSNTDISFSPDRVAAAAVNFIPVKNGQISFLSKYVSREYLDNTSHLNRSIDPYFVENLRFDYSIISIHHIKAVDFIFQINNLFNKKYVSNGYTYPYIYGGSLIVENYFFPMAPTNFLAAVNIKL
ncbi:MAG TPA: TonB-dependent receptor plug domain-containing protein [Chitinophagaceae bacterium]|nr:TonB-dependent receptor plug domain-containing protein [Chitinophagaceae bacterium]